MADKDEVNAVEDVLQATLPHAPQGAVRGPGVVRLSKSLAGRHGHGGVDAAAAASPAISFTDVRSRSLYDALTDTAGINVGDSDAVGLRAMVWRGITHPALRPFAWRALLQYPHSAGAPDPVGHARALARRLAEYRDYVAAYFDPRGTGAGGVERLPQEQAILHQISVDMPRHSLGVYHSTALRARFERILFVWSVRHPATSYVQGFDDVVGVFFTTFLAERLTEAFVKKRLADAVKHRLGSRSTSLDDMHSQPQQQQQQQPAVRTMEEDIRAVSSSTMWDHTASLAYGNNGVTSGKAIDSAMETVGLSEAELNRMETDVFFCAGAVLEWVQHHFIYGMPGIHAAMRQVERICRVADSAYMDFLDERCMVVASFLYPWVHCFLIRLVPPELAPRLFDTYLAVGATFPRFVEYLCAALLLSTQHKLRGKPMEQLQQVLQRPTLVAGNNASKDAFDDLRQTPTAAWLDTLIADAYLLQLKFPPAADEA